MRRVAERFGNNQSITISGEAKHLQHRHVRMTWMRQFRTISPQQVDENRFKLFLVSFGSVVMVLPVFLWILELLSVQIYFILSFIWLLVSSEIFAPEQRMNGWWGWLQLLKLIGWIGLAYIVIERVVLVVT